MFPSQCTNSTLRGRAGKGPRAECVCFAVIPEPRYLLCFSKAWVARKPCLEIETILHAAHSVQWGWAASGLYDSCSMGTAAALSIMLSAYISHLHLTAFPALITEWGPELQVPTRSHVLRSSLDSPSPSPSLWDSWCWSICSPKGPEQPLKSVGQPLVLQQLVLCWGLPDTSPAIQSFLSSQERPEVFFKL